MPDDQYTTQNPISTENPNVVSPQEPTEPVPENTTVSDPSNMPSEAPESPINVDIPVSLNNPNPENTPVLTEKLEELKPAESVNVEAENSKIESVSEPVKSSETQTAQMAGNEPLDEPAKEKTPEPQTQKAEATPPPVMQTSRNRVLELLNKAKLAIQFRKRKKLDRIMSLFLQKSKITNDEVEKYLHVSDATAERYLNILEKENKIKQVGKTGKAVSYSKI